MKDLDAQDIGKKIGNEDLEILFDSLAHAGELRALSREIRHRLKPWVIRRLETSHPADTKAWEFMKQLYRLEDMDAIEDGADPDEIYANNSIFPPEFFDSVEIDWSSVDESWLEISLWDPGIESEDP